MRGLGPAAMVGSMLRLAALLSVLVLSATASADPPPVAQVRTMLSAFEGGPSAEQWQALGPETLEVLEQLYDDAGQPPFVRLRAVQAAGHFPSEASRSFLKRVATAEGQNDLLIRAALRTMARAFGGATLADIRPFLSHREVTVREGAVLALGAIESPRARALLQARLDVERDATVQATLRRALR